MFTVAVRPGLALRLVDEYNLTGLAQLMATQSADPHYTFEGDSPQERAQNFIARSRRQYAYDDALDATVVQNDEVIGLMSLAEMHDTHRARLTWHGPLTPDILIDCARMLCAYGFRTLRHHRIGLLVSPDREDIASALIRTLGFSSEGRLRAYWLQGTTAMDVRSYSLLAQEHIFRIEGDDLEFSHDLGDGFSIRIFRLADLPQLFKTVYANREHLSRWLPFAAHTHSPEDERPFIMSVRRQIYDSQGWQAGIWQSGSIVGSIGYHYWDRQHGTTEMGYWLAKSATGKGIMTRATRALCDYAFDIIGLHRIEIHCGTGNTASCAIPQRLGFRLEGVIRHGQELPDGPIDWNRFALLAPERSW